MIVLERSAYWQQSRSFSRNARLFLLSQLLAGFGSGIFSLLFNLYLVRLGFHEDFIGQVSGVSTLTTGLVAIPAGLLADRLGRRRSMLAGGVIVPLAYLAQTSVLQPQTVLLLAVLAGAGMALIMISFNPFMVENSTPAERPYLFSLSFALIMLSSMVGNLAGGVLPRLLAGVTNALPGDALPYRLALWASVVMFAVAAIPFYLLSEDRQRAAQAETPAADVSMATADVYKRMAVFALANALVGIAAGLIIPFFNVYFLKQFNLPAERVGLVFAVSQALMGIAMLLSPALVRRTGKVAAIVAGHFWVLPFLAILAVTNNAWLAALAFWGRNVGINMINPVYGAFAMEMVPQRLRATLSGVNNTTWNIAWAASAAAGGALILTRDYASVFVLSAVFYALTGLVYAVAFRRYWRKM